MGGGSHRPAAELPEEEHELTAPGLISVAPSASSPPRMRFLETLPGEASCCTVRQGDANSICDTGSRTSLKHGSVLTAVGSSSLTAVGSSPRQRMTLSPSAIQAEAPTRQVSSYGEFEREAGQVSSYGEFERIHTYDHIRTREIEIQTQPT